VSGKYRLHIARSAAKDLAERLPEKVARVVYEFITRPLLDNPQRVGKPLNPPLAPAWSARRGSYRVLYVLNEEQKIVKITAIRHRADAYQT